MQIGDVIDGPTWLNTASRFSQRTNKQWRIFFFKKEKIILFLNLLILIKCSIINIMMMFLMI